MSEKPAYDIAKALAYLDPLQLGPPELAIERIDDPAVRVQPEVGRTAAALLDLLVRLQRPERILEIGTCLGYAACALGRAARDHGCLLYTSD
ncbi:MAG: hypothetical protein QUU85_05570, partial [Candidatus Eisenbacteria bacterium]|nr:hypothetical protein [Candidatus Eisenbacteria bacterium]